MPDRTAVAPRAGDYRVLDLFHLGTAAVVISLVALDAETRGGGLVVALAALAAMTIGYALAGRALVRREAPGGRAAWTYLLVLLALFAVACWCSPVAAWLLFSLCLQAFTLLPLWQGVGVVAAANLVPSATDLLSPRHDAVSAGAGLWRALAITAAGALAAAWVDSVARRSAERADLVSALQASQARVRELSRQAGTDAERARLSGEIHDTLAQGFLSILNLVRAAAATLHDDPDAATRYLTLAQDSARDNLAEARAMVAALAPPALEEEGLVGALHRRARRLQEETGIVTAVQVGELPPLGRDAEVVLLRAAQELLTNVEKHARASRVSVQLWVDAASGHGSAVLTVTDDGVGPQTGSGAGFGLPAMRERAATLRGSVTVSAAREGGTVAVVTVAIASDPGLTGTLAP